MRGEIEQNVRPVATLDHKICHSSQCHSYFTNFVSGFIRLYLPRGWSLWLGKYPWAGGKKRQPVTPGLWLMSPAAKKPGSAPSPTLVIKYGTTLLFNPSKSNSCNLYTLPHRPNLPFLISDILELWRSGLTARVPERWKFNVVG